MKVLENDEWDVNRNLCFVDMDDAVELAGVPFEKRFDDVDTDLDLPNSRENQGMDQPRFVEISNSIVLVWDGSYGYVGGHSLAVDQIVEVGGENNFENVRETVAGGEMVQEPQNGMSDLILL